ncbi:MAG: hypothetical protein AAF587_16765 [Bacteroidota bacterium]
MSTSSPYSRFLRSMMELKKSEFILSDSAVAQGITHAPTPFPFQTVNKPDDFVEIFWDQYLDHIIGEFFDKLKTIPESTINKHLTLFKQQEASRAPSPSKAYSIALCQKVEKIQSVLTYGELTYGLKLLNELAKRFRSIEQVFGKDISLLNTQFHDIDRRSSLSLLSEEDYLRSRQKTINGVLRILDQIKENHGSDS